MTDRPTPETDTALYRGMTAAETHAMLQRLERELAEARAAAKQPLPWKHIGELGEIAYMEDGSRCWTLKPGYEDTRLFLVHLSSGEVETHFAYIDDSGSLCDHNGDDVVWLWCDAEYFMDIPARPSTPSNPATPP